MTVTRIGVVLLRVSMATLFYVYNTSVFNKVACVLT